MIYLAITAFFFILLIVYFRLADHFNIIDKPNERSSHTTVTIRGGGIIFIVAALTAICLHFSGFWIPALGIFIIGLISFLDDIYSLPNRVRIVFHIAAVSLMFYYLHIYSTFPVHYIVALYILVIGIINAYNFMDGINGITGLYSLVILAGLQYVNIRQLPFINADMIWLPMIACVVFLFFNFRKKAVCFAGDVGSVTIAFWIITLLLNLIFTTGNWSYILFLSIYGVDTVLTIMHRLLLKQNIFKAHRLHFYQILANERKMPHLVVSSIYAVLQACICLFIIYAAATRGVVSNFTIVLVPLVMLYIVLKPSFMKKPANILS
jgi:UDP-N-acetylmuramyl pentapeptide phosphotransferase/UDP-N-acetylglucosamine-1-phosphate transferase